MYFLDVAFFVQEHAELIKSILFNVITFIVFLLILNLIAKRIKVQVDNIERNTEYMKKDFRTIKQEFEITREHINSLKNGIDVGGVVYKNLYESPNLIKNEFITMKQNLLQLSAMGYIVSTKIGLQKIVAENWDKILPYIKDSTENYSDHPYDIQVYCLYIGSCIDLFLTPDDINRMKHYAIREGHLLLSYFAIIGVLIKEKYFEENNIQIAPFIPFKN